VSDWAPHPKAAEPQIVLEVEAGVSLDLYGLCTTTAQPGETPLNTFCQKHAEKITGVLSCPDRVVFKGYLPFNYPEAMEHFMSSQGLLLRDFKDFCRQESERVKEHAIAMARRLDRPYEYLNHFVRKEDHVRKILQSNPVPQGLVCVLATNESSGSFKLRYGKGRPRLIASKPKCLCLYFYFLDCEFGLMHVRLQTWFPFTIQICVNGHGWLGRKLRRYGVEYTAVDNAITAVSDFARAQRFADRFFHRPWPRLLEAFAQRVNPLFKDLLAGHSHYWVVDQFEYATDIVFKDTALKDLYKPLLEHATLCFSAEDVLIFLGRKLNGNFTGDVLNDKKRRQQGARVKHRMKENWIKMYDKFGCVLRIETVINHPYEFRVRREGKRQGNTIVGWLPMAKGVANLPRYAEVARAANQRYIEALAAVDDPSEALQELPRLAKPVRKNKRSHRGFNPLSRQDLDLFTAVMRGEHALHGFRNRDIRLQLFPASATPKQKVRQSARVSRLLRLLHAHGIIAKIPRSHRWRVTTRGHKLLGAAITAAYKLYPEHYMQNAA
jgi:hypothetical protein